MFKGRQQNPDLQYRKNHNAQHTKKKITHTKKQGNVTCNQEKNQSIATDLEKSEMNYQAETLKQLL